MALPRVSRPEAPSGGRSTAANGADLEWAERAIARKKLRRLHAAAAVRRRQILATLELLDSGKGPQGRKRRELGTFSWEDHVARLTQRSFKLRYRLTHDSFMKLLDDEDFGIRGDLTVTNEKMAKRAKWGQLIQPETKLAMALRYLAGASVLDLELIYFVSNSYVYDCVWCVVDAVNRRLNVEFPMDDVAKLKVLEAEWAAKARCKTWRGQVAAVDGVFFPMLAPSSKDVHDPMRYHVSRKDKYALLCMALCDAHGCIMEYDISQAPQTHDSLAWALSEVGMRVANGELPAPFFINADAAFPLSNSMITPSGGGGVGWDTFDYHQSSNRVAIERAFGMLIRRWAVLWKPLAMRFDRRAPVVGACIRLHNFCIREGIEEETDVDDTISQIQPCRWAVTPKFDRDGRPVKYLKIKRGEKQRHAKVGTLPHTALRNWLFEQVQQSGIVRPQPRPGYHKKKRGRGKHKK